MKKNRIGKQKFLNFKNKKPFFTVYSLLGFCFGLPIFFVSETAYAFKESGKSSVFLTDHFSLGTTPSLFSLNQVSALPTGSVAVTPAQAEGQAQRPTVWSVTDPHLRGGDIGFDETAEPVGEARVSSEGASNTPSVFPGFSGNQSLENSIHSSEFQNKISSIGVAKDPAVPFKLYLSAFVVCFVAGGYFLFKKGFRNLGSGAKKEEPVASVISKIQIAPKRYIIVLKFRDEEILISSTEMGVKTLSHAFSPEAQKKAHKKPSRQINNQLKFLDQPYTKTAAAASEILSAHHSAENTVNNGKNNTLSQALQRLSEQRENLKSDTKMVAEKQPSLNAKENSLMEDSRLSFGGDSEPTMDGFKSFYKNQFKNENQENITKEKNIDKDFSSGGDVTSLIREKLKSMQTLS